MLAHTINFPQNDLFYSLTINHHSFTAASGLFSHSQVLNLLKQAQPQPHPPWATPGVESLEKQLQTDSPLYLVLDQAHYI